MSAAFRATICVFAAFAVISLASAEAAAPSYPTQLGLISLGNPTPGYAGAVGHLKSPEAACIQGRSVSVFAHFPSGKTKLLDTDLSSGRGYWGVVFKETAFGSADFLVLRLTGQRVAGGRSGTVRCLSDSLRIA